MWLVYRDAELQINRNQITKTQISNVSFKKNKYFQKPNPTQAIDLESEQFILQLFWKLIAPIVSEFKS